MSHSEQSGSESGGEQSWLITYLVKMLRNQYFYTTLIKHATHASPVIGWATVFGAGAIAISVVTMGGEYGPEWLLPVFGVCFTLAIILYVIHFGLWFVSRIWRFRHGYGRV